MPFFVTVLEGLTPEDARPIIAIRDAKILAAVRAMIYERLTEDPASRVVSLSKRAKVVTPPATFASYDNETEARQRTGTRDAVDEARQPEDE